MTRGVVHVVGAGLSGLASAVALVGAGATVRVHEAARFAGGRCRSYFEPSLGIAIDNGNHLLLSGNRATLAYLATLGAGDRLAGPQRAEYDFADLASGARWRLRINDGRLPWWNDLLRGRRQLCHRGPGWLIHRRDWHQLLLS